TGPNASELTRLQSQLATLTRASEILRVELRLPDGKLLAASDGAAADLAQTGDLFGRAAGGASQATIGTAPTEGVGAASGTASVLLEFLPLAQDGRVRAVVGIWRDAAPI